MSKAFSSDTETQQTGLDTWRKLVNAIHVHFEFDAPDPDAFTGRLVEHVLGPIRIFEITASAHQVRRTAAHVAYGEAPRTLVTMHEAGHGEVEHEGRIYHLQPGDITVLHSTRPFTLRFQGDMKEHLVSIPAQMLSHELIASRHLSAISIPCRTGIGRIARELVSSTLTCVEDLSGTEKERLARSLIEVFNIVAGSALERSGKEFMDPGLYQTERIKLYISENLRDPDLGAGRIAAALGISQRYMNKLFEGEGTTVGRTVLARRLYGCKTDLEDPFNRGKSVTEIAYAWGFNSASHFSRAFRKHFGMSPREAREAC